jgi:AraC-like DNA-binding protein
MNAAPHTVTASWLVGVLDRFAALGLPLEVLVAETGIVDWARLPPTRQFRLVTVRRLWHRAAALSDDPLIGLKVGAALPPQSLNVVGVLLMQSPTLRETFGDVVRYHPLVSRSGAFSMRSVHGGASLEYRPTPCEVPMHPAHVDSVFAGLLTFVRRCLPSGTRVGHVGLPGADPRLRADYEGVLGCRVTLCRAPAVFVADAHLDAPIPGADPTLARIARERAEAMLRTVDRSETLVDRVQAKIVDLGFEAARCDTVAAALGTSVRTLQRRLGELDTSFRGLVESARMAEALRHLADRRLPIGVIADRLGYSEVSAFSRAVSVHWGRPPSALRTELARGVSIRRRPAGRRAGAPRTPA